MTRKQAVQFLTQRPAEFGRMLGFTKLTEMHNAWMVDMINGTTDATLQSHRGSYKTTCVSISLAIITVLLPNDRTMFMRKTDGDVKEIIQQVQNILKSPYMQYFVQTIYGVALKMPVENQTEITTNLTTDIKGTAQLVGIGTGASLTGKHFDRIFTDDIVNVQDRISKAERDRTKLIYQELQNIKNRGGRIYNTGTPWHKDDAFTLMPNIQKHDCYATGLISTEELEEIKQRMLPSLFAANYELRNIASEDVIFTTPQVGANAGLAEQGICHVDAAYGGQDWTAMTIINRKDGVYYVYGRCWRKSVEELEETIKAEYTRFMCSRAYAEDNADKGFLARDLRKIGMKVNTYHENMNKFLKITSFLKSAWKSVVFVDGTDQDYIDQICDYNENAEHDDCPDSLASAVRIYSRKSDDVYVPIYM